MSVHTEYEVELLAGAILKIIFIGSIKEVYTHVIEHRNMRMQCIAAENAESTGEAMHGDFNSELFLYSITYLCPAMQPEQFHRAVARSVAAPPMVYPGIHGMQPIEKCIDSVRDLYHFFKYAPNTSDPHYKTTQSRQARMAQAVDDGMEYLRLYNVLTADVTFFAGLAKGLLMESFKESFHPPTIPKHTSDSRMRRWWKLATRGKIDEHVVFALVALFCDERLYLRNGQKITGETEDAIVNILIDLYKGSDNCISRAVFIQSRDENFYTQTKWAERKDLLFTKLVEGALNRQVRILSSNNATTAASS